MTAGLRRVWNNSQQQPLDFAALNTANRQNWANQNIFGSNLTSGVYGSAGSSLLGLSNLSETAGFDNAAQGLRKRSTALLDTAGQFATQHADIGSVNDFGTLVDSAKANAGQGLGSMAQILAAAPLGVVGGVAAATAPMYGENIARLEQDQSLQGLEAGQKALYAAPAAVVQGGLNYLVPGGVAGKLGTSIAARTGTGALGKAATVLGTNMAVEGATEAGEEATRQGMHTLANPNRDASKDTEELIQAGYSGALGGSPIGAVQAGAGYVQDRMAERADEPGMVRKMAETAVNRAFDKGKADADARARVAHEQIDAFEAEAQARGVPFSQVWEERQAQRQAARDTLTKSLDLTGAVTEAEATERLLAHEAERAEAAEVWRREVLADNDAAPAEKELAERTGKQKAAGAFNADELAAEELSLIDATKRRVMEGVDKFVDTIEPVAGKPAPKNRRNAMTTKKFGDIEYEGPESDSMPAGEGAFGYTEFSGVRANEAVAQRGLEGRYGPEQEPFEPSSERRVVFDERNRIDFYKTLFDQLDQQAVQTGRQSPATPEVRKAFDQPPAKNTSEAARREQLLGKFAVDLRSWLPEQVGKDLDIMSEALMPRNEFERRARQMWMVKQDNPIRALDMESWRKLDRSLKSYVDGGGDKNTRAIIDDLFGDPEVTQRILMTYAPGRSESRGQQFDGTNGNGTSVTGANLDGDNEKTFADGDVSTEFEIGSTGNVAAEREGRRYGQGSIALPSEEAKAQADKNYKPRRYFDTRDEAQSERLKKTVEALGRPQSDAAAVRVQEMGMVDREVQARAAENPEAVEAVQLEVTNEYFSKSQIQKPAKPENFDSMNKLAQADYNRRVREFEKELARRVKVVNARYRTAEAVSVEAEVGGLDFTKEDIDGVKLNYGREGVKNPKASPLNGTLVFEREGTKEPFMTTAPKLIGRAIKLNAARETTNETNTGVNEDDYLLKLAISSMLSSDQGFTRIGYADGYGNVKWLGENGVNDLPDNFKLRQGRGAQPRTVATLKEEKVRRAETAAKDAKRFAERVRGLVESEYEQRQLAKGDPLLSDAELKDVENAVKAYEADNTNYVAANAVTAMYRKHIGGAFSASEGGGVNPAQVPSESTVFTDENGEPLERGLLAYGNVGQEKEARVQRNDRGMQSGLEGYGTVGTSREGGSSVAQPATKPLPEEARNIPKNDKADPFDFVVELVRAGAPKFNAAFKKADSKQQRKIRENLRALTKLSPTGVINSVDKTLTEAEAQKLLTRAKKFLVAVTVGEITGQQAEGETAEREVTGLSVTESNASGYRQRTQRNANAADVTIAFAVDYETAGERLTRNVAGDKYVRYDGALGDFVNAIVAKLKAVNGTSINVAGNGIYTWAKEGRSQEWVNKAMHKVLSQVKEAYPKLTTIVTGGQTGTDIAGAIAGRALGLTVDVHMPKGFRQRNAEGVDFNQTAADVENYINTEAAKIGKPNAQPLAQRVATARKVEFGELDEGAIGSFLKDYVATAKWVEDTADLREEKYALREKKNRTEAEERRLDQVEDMLQLSLVRASPNENYADVYRDYVEELQELGNEHPFRSAQIMKILDGLDELARRAVTGDLSVKRLSNAQSSQTPSDQARNDKEMSAALAEVRKLLGKSFPVRAVKQLLADGVEISGDMQDNLIRISVNAQDKLGVGRHEALHQMFQWLRENGNSDVIKLLQNVATNASVQRQLKKELAEHPNALEQLNDPEEAAAYLFQFWMAGQVQLGPKTETFFEKVLDVLNRVQLAVREVLFGSKSAFDARQTARREKLAEALMADMGSGALADADNRVRVIQVLEENAKAVESRRANTMIFGQKFHDTIRKAFFSNASIFEDSDNRAVQALGKMFFRMEGDKRDKQAYIERVAQITDRNLVKLRNILHGADKETLELVGKYVNDRRDTDSIHHPEAKRIVGELRELLKQIHLFQQQRKTARWDADKHDWVVIGTVESNYWARVWSLDVLSNKQGLFLEKMTAALEKYRREHNGYPEVVEFRADLTARAILHRLINGSGAHDIEENTSELGLTPYQASVNKRSLEWLDDVAPGEFTEFMSQDVVETMTNYINQSIKRTVYQEEFGYGGEKIREAMDEAYALELGGEELVKRAQRGLKEATKSWKAEMSKWIKAGAQGDKPDAPTLRSVAQRLYTKEHGAEKADAKRAEIVAKLEPVALAVQALEGTLGHDINPNLRHAFSAITTLQNFQKLIFALFASMNDIVGLVARGGTMKDSFQALARGAREITMMWQGTYSQDELAKMAEEIGAVGAGNYLDAMGQAYSSQFMHGKLRTLNDKLFKWNGLEAWNRAVRIQATGAAMRFIQQHATKDKQNEHSQRYLDELFGEGYDAKLILNDKGELDLSNDRVKEAIVAWVNGAVLRPNASHRPVYASDPHYQLFYHLKQFAYSFHKVILRRAWVEAKHGNYVPATALFTGYVPVSIAADVVKELLIVGDDDPWWLKAGATEYLSHGISRANLGGVPQMWLGDVVPDPIALFKDPGEQAARWAANVSNVAGPAPDQVLDMLSVPLFESKSLERELAGGLPGGVLWRRYVD